MSTALRIGLAGGNFGLRVLAPALRAAGFEITAFAGRDAATARRLADAHGIPTACAGVDALLDETLDAVALALPPADGAVAAAAAIARGLPIFAEKPLATSADAALGLVRAATVSGVPCAVDFEFPELIPFQALRASVTDGTLGTVHQVQITWRAGAQSASARPSWKASAGEGGGLMGLYGVHILHAAEWLCGPIAEIGMREAPPCAQGAMLEWRWRTGALGSAVLTMAASGPSFQRWEISASRGFAILENVETGMLAGFRLRLCGADGRTLAIHSDPDAEAGGIAVPVARLARRFAARVRGEAAGFPGPAAAHRALVLAEAARRANPLVAVP